MFNLLLDGEIQIPALWVSAIIMIIAVIAIAFLLDDNHKGYDTKTIAVCAISIALSAVLFLIKLFYLPQGGSVTLASLVPLLIFSYFYGTKKGLLAGVILGLINCLSDFYFIHPMQFALDYIIAFGAIGLAGMFKKIAMLSKYPQICFAIGSIVAGIICFISHVLSGVFAFSQFTTMDVLVYSLAYNSFVFIDLAIAVAVGIALLSSKQLIKLLSPKN